MYNPNSSSLFVVRNTLSWRERIRLWVIEKHSVFLATRSCINKNALVIKYISIARTFGLCCSGPLRTAFDRFILLIHRNILTQISMTNYNPIVKSVSEFLKQRTKTN